MQRTVCASSWHHVCAKGLCTGSCAFSSWLHVQVKSLDTWTHAYSFWEGVPVASRRAFARLFCASKTLQVMLHP